MFENFFFFFPSGTEPWSFYFINGFLNFNVAFILALLVLPLTYLMECLLQKFHGECRIAVRAEHREPRLQTLLVKAELVCQRAACPYWK